MQSKARVGVGYLLGPRFGLVRATVEDQQDLVLFGADALLLRERLKAGDDEFLLVAGRNDHADLQRRVGRREGGTSGHQGRGGSLLDELTALLVVLVGVV